MNKDVVRELNAYLKGEHMAVKAYGHYIERIKDEKMKQELMDIQSDHRQHADKVADRIRQLGGKPAKGPGMMGMMSEVKNLLKKNSDDTQFILKDAGKGEYRGIKMAGEIVKGDLDPESLNLVKSLLEEDRSHVSKLGEYIH
jgi:bacterioferritin